jgi:hypothetical protein
MRLPIGISPPRPACARCGGKTVFSGRQSHPDRGLPWELQTFVCTSCSAVTVRHTGGDIMVEVPPMPGHGALAATWTHDVGGYTAVLQRRAFRIVAYPRGSPLAGQYGCYCKARFIGLAADLAAAKVVCGTHAERAAALPAA